MVFYDDECNIWKNRLLIVAYIEYHDNFKVIAEILYSIFYDNNNFEEFLKIILKRSVYEYYFSLKFNTEENQNKFTLKQLDDIIEIIEKKWVKDV